MIAPAASRGLRRATGPLVVGALVVGVLAAGCTAPPSDVGPSADASADPGGSGPVQPDAGHGDHHADADGDRVPVGPLSLFAADYWSVIQPGEGLTAVRAGGCPEGQNCPTFEILDGAALEGVNPDAAYLPDDAVCPGNDALDATAGALVESSEVEVGGESAVLSRFSVACVDDAGEEVRTTEQLQWYVADGPSGAALVVDRWAFEGLESRLAAATWRTT